MDKYTKMYWIMRYVYIILKCQGGTFAYLLFFYVLTLLSCVFSYFDIFIFYDKIPSLASYARHPAVLKEFLVAASICILFMPVVVVGLLITAIPVKQGMKLYAGDSMGKIIFRWVMGPVFFLIIFYVMVYAQHYGTVEQFIEGRSAGYRAYPFALVAIDYWGLFLYLPVGMFSVSVAFASVFAVYLAPIFHLINKGDRRE